MRNLAYFSLPMHAFFRFFSPVVEGEANGVISWRHQIVAWLRALTSKFGLRATPMLHAVAVAGKTIIRPPCTSGDTLANRPCADCYLARYWGARPIDASELQLVYLTALCGEAASGVSPSPDGTLAALRASASQYSDGDHADMAEKLEECMGQLYPPRTGRKAGAANSTNPSQTSISMADSLPPGSVDASASSRSHVICVTSDDASVSSPRHSSGPCTLLGAVKGSQVCEEGVNLLVTSPPPSCVWLVPTACRDCRDFNGHALSCMVSNGPGDHPGGALHRCAREPGSAAWGGSRFPRCCPHTRSSRKSTCTSLALKLAPLLRFMRPFMRLVSLTWRRRRSGSCSCAASCTWTSLPCDSACSSFGPIWSQHWLPPPGPHLGVWTRRTFPAGAFGRWLTRSMAKPCPPPSRTSACRSPLTDGPISILLSQLHERTLRDAVSAEAEMRPVQTQSSAALGIAAGRITSDSTSEEDRSPIDPTDGVRATDVGIDVNPMEPPNPRPEDQGYCCDCTGGPVNRNDSSVTLPRATAAAGATHVSPRMQLSIIRVRRVRAPTDERVTSRAQPASTTLRVGPVAATPSPCPSLPEREPPSFARQQDPLLSRPWWSCWGTF